MKRLLRNVLAAFVVSTVGAWAQAPQPGDDMTSYITNPNAASNISGWTASGADAHRHSGNGFDGTAGFFELCTWGGAWDLSLFQTVTGLPNGYYCVKAAGQMSGVIDAWMKLVANGHESQFARNGASGGNILADGSVTTYGAGVAGWRYTSVIAKVTDGTLAISVVGHSNVKERWANFDNVTLTFLGTTLPANTDVTCAINNPSFESRDLNGWSIPKSSSDTGVFTPDGNHATSGAEGYYIFNTWWQGVPLTQTIADLPTGKYKLTASIASSDANADAKIYLLGNDRHSDVITITQGTSGTFSDYNYEFVSTASSVTIGVVGGNADGTYNADGHWWYKADHFRLTYLEPTVEAAATALPANGNMAAGTWYYFDIPAVSDYSISASTLADIAYTTNGLQLVSATTSTWTSSTQELAAGRYYVKSSSAQTLTVNAQAYTYTVGTATTDKAYIQPGQTVTITYADAVTNNGSASFAIQGSPSIMLGSTAVTPTVTANGFTFNVPSGLTNGTTYMLSIPAGALGFAAGNTFNEAQQIALTTTALYDGVYFLKAAKATTDTSIASCDDTEAAGKYLSRGGAYGTHATLDKYGLALQISTDSENYSLLRVYDTKRYFFNITNDNSRLYEMYADGTGGTADNEKFVIQNHLGYLAIIPHQYINNPHFLKVNTGEQALDIIPVYADGPTAGPIILFTAETPSEHATAMAALKDAQAATAASEAYAGNSSTYDSLNGVMNVSAMETAVSNLDRYVVVGGNAPTSVKEKYQGAQPNPAPETVYTDTLTIPAPGLYRFSMQAFYRAASNANTQAMHTDGADFSPVVLFFGNSETQIKSLYDEDGGATAYVEGNDVQYNSMYYANNMPGALKMFQEGKYHNDVWFYAPTAGDYPYGVKYMGHANANAQWFIYSPEAVTVTYYGTGTINVSDGIVTVMGNNNEADINRALTSDIAVLNIEQAVDLNDVQFDNSNNPNLLIYANSTNQVTSSTRNVIVNGVCAELVLSKHSSPFFVPKAFTATDATYTVRPTDLADGQFATLMIPFAARVPTGRAYTLNQGVNVLGDDVNATEITEAEVPANSPVLITGTGTFSSTSSNANIPVIAKDATFTSGELVGVYSTTQAPVSSYVLQNHTSSPNGVAFYRVADTQPNVGPFRAYIKAQGSSVKSRALYINFGGDATGISTLDAEGNVSLSSAEYYTAGGTRLSAPQKGLNIVKYGNGTVKKIFVK